MSWDAHPEVLSPVGRSFADLMAEERLAARPKA